ncbi:MAG: PAS domain S-box-containing protein [Sulfurimonas sp.]
MQYKKIIENISGWLWAVDTSGRYTYCSQNIFDLLGYTAEEVIGKTPFYFMREEESLRVSNIFRDLSINCAPIKELENANIHKDGSIVILKTNAIPVYDENGVWLGYEGIDRDITYEKNLEQELEKRRFELETKNIQLLEREAQLLQAQELAKIGNWSLDVKSMEADWSTEMRQICGIDKDTSVGPEFLSKVVHPDDWPALYNSLMSACHDGTPHQMIYRIKRDTDSKTRWVDCRGVRIIDKNGITKIVGSFQDITEQKALEQELAQSYEKLYKLTENIPGAIYQYKLDTDGSSRFTYASKGIENVYEISSEDIVKDGSYIFRCTHKDDIDTFEATTNESAQKLQEWNIEYRVNLPKKGLRWLHGKSTPEKLADGSILWSGVIDDITEQKDLEQKLEESFGTLYKLTQNIPGVIYQYRIYPDGKITFPYVSSNTKDIWERTTEEVLKDPTSAFSRVHPDDIEKIATTVEDSKKSMKDWCLEYRVNLPEKGLRWLSGQAKPEKLEDGSILWHGYIHDITDQVVYKEKLLLQKELLQQKKLELETIIHEAPNPIMISEEGGKILILNQAWVSSSGYSLEDVPTIKAWIDSICVNEQSRISMIKHTDSIYEITQKVDDGEFTFLTKNRDVMTWKVYTAPLGLVDGKRRIITSAMDITELKRKDEMLISQSRHAAMGEMIGMIAHQWRQPLSTIAMSANNMLLDIALNTFNASEAEQYANNISEQTQHLSQTIDDFRNFFKPDKEISKVDIKDILDKTLSIVQDSLRNHSIGLKITFETQTKVNAFERELMQVLVNIITNAKDALVSNESENPTIYVRAYEDDKYINTEICDNGGGIDANILEKVFDPYFSTKEEKNGTGLGLYMSKMIIQKHLKGILEVKNNKDGACFTIKLLK